jgi:D-sedoheptulose 7-phosphate isomerase
MDHELLVDANLLDLVKIASETSKQQKKQIVQIALGVAASIKKGGTVFWCGNGGSAADAQHLSAELIGRLVNNRKPLSSIALNSDIAALTCISNDFGYEEIFSRQLEGLAKQDDFLILLSTSGKSENILRCLEKAKQLQIPVASLLGKGGGDLFSLSDFEIVINSNNTARIQEMHKFIGHSICQIIERELGFHN